MEQKIIIIYEVKTIANVGLHKSFVPTGRKILMGADAPIFRHMGTKGEQAIKFGEMALDEEMFSLMEKHIKEAEEK